MLSAEVVIRNIIDFKVSSKIALMIKLNHNIFEKSQASCSGFSTVAVSINFKMARPNYNLIPKEVTGIFIGVNGSSSMNRKHQPCFKHEESVVSLSSTVKKTFRGTKLMLGNPAAIILASHCETTAKRQK